MQRVPPLGLKMQRVPPLGFWIWSAPQAKNLKLLHYGDNILPLKINISAPHRRRIMLVPPIQIFPLQVVSARRRRAKIFGGFWLIFTKKTSCQSAFWDVFSPQNIPKTTMFSVCNEYVPPQGGKSRSHQTGDHMDLSSLII